MAHFTYVKAGGIWNTLPVDYSDFAGLDQRVFKAINGDDGGVWAPSSAIVIGGAGLQVDGPFVATDATFAEVTVNGGLSVLGFTELAGLFLSGGLTVTLGTTFGGDVIAQGELTVDGEFNADAVANLNAGLVLAGGASVTGGISMSGDPLQLSGGATLQIVDSGGATIAGLTSLEDLELTGEVTSDVSATGWILAQGGFVDRTTTGADANTTYSPRDFGLVRVAVGGLSGNRTYELADVAFGKMRFCTAHTAHSIAIARPGGSPQIAVIRGDGTGPTGVGNGFFTWVDVAVVAGAWQVVAIGAGPLT